MPNGDDDLLTARQAARLLGVQPGTIYSLVHDGSLRHHVVGKRKLFRRDELLAWRSKPRDRHPVVIAGSELSDRIGVVIQELQAIRQFTKVWVTEWTHREALAAEASTTIQALRDQLADAARQIKRGKREGE